MTEHWDGTSAAITSSPKLNGALYGVWCLSESSCFLVGFSNAATLIEHGNGTTSFAVAAGPANGSQSKLQHVSCASATLCFAVGSSYNGSVTKTLIERWNGSSWSIATSPNGPGASNVLTSVSCPATKMCLAVGASGHKTLVERWNGTSWSIFSPARVGTLNAVTCRTSQFCIAVGQSGSKTLVERWRGNGWTVGPSPNRTGANTSSLSGVSCPSANVCFAVGASGTNSGNKTLVERWNGGKWSIIASPNHGNLSALASVSCVGTNNCFAVGASPDRPLAERWNGKKWTLATLPATGSNVGDALNDVSCVSASSCVAVGTIGSSPDFSALVEKWNGTKWSTVAIPSPAGAESTGLSGVSCRTATSCFAAGDFAARSSSFTLIERFA